MGNRVAGLGVLTTSNQIHGLQRVSQPINSPYTPWVSGQSEEPDSEFLP
jgi:hypothetical protein